MTQGLSARRTSLALEPRMNSAEKCRMKFPIPDSGEDGELEQNREGKAERVRRLWQLSQQETAGE